MPGSSGLQVLNEIRKENKAIKFIILILFLTGYYRQMAIQSGADYFFSKVDDFEKIALVADEMLGNEQIT